MKKPQYVGVKVTADMARNAKRAGLSVTALIRICVREMGWQVALLSSK